MQKSVYTFQFDRRTPVTPGLQQKLIKARDTMAVGGPFFWQLF